MEFDDVLNYQRKIFYTRRRNILLGDPEAIKAYVEEIVGHASPEERLVIEEKIAKAERSYLNVLRQVILQTMDMFWVDHLEMMDYMRSSVNLRAYGQRDPLVEYKREGLKLFKDMELSISIEVLKLIPQIQPNLVFANEPTKLVETRQGAEDLTAEASKPAEKTNVTPDGQKIGRNDLCWCGSGKKYKHCHGK